MWMFVFGFIVGVVTVVVWACAVNSSDADKGG